jgi:hypothetical protein
MFLVALMLTLLGAPHAAAQEATPATGVVPDPSECQVEPRSAEEITALWARAANIGTPIEEVDELVQGTPDGSEFGTPQAVIVDVPVGDPADAETIEAVTATVRELIACINAGDYGRALSLYSDDLVRELAPEQPFDAEQAKTFLASEPVALPEASRLVLIAVIDVTVQDDGRIGAIVVSNDPAIGQPNQTETSLVYFSQDEGRWVIDGIVGGAVGAPDAEGGNLLATPEI